MADSLVDDAHSVSFAASETRGAYLSPRRAISQALFTWINAELAENGQQNSESLLPLLTVDGQGDFPLHAVLRAV